MTRTGETATRVLEKADLVRITGAQDVAVLRVRQRPERTVLHVGLRDEQGREVGQGAIWCFAGDKARRVAEKHPASIVDPVTGAVFDRFPGDHRLPEITAFLDWVTQDAPDDQRAVIAPEILRYRPGLSCTFGIHQRDGRHVFTKIIAKEDVSVIAERLSHLSGRSLENGVKFTSPLRTQPEFRAITYEKAEGRSLGTLLCENDPGQVHRALQRTVSALTSLPADRRVFATSLSIVDLREQAQRNYARVCGLDAGAAATARTLLSRISAAPPQVRAMPIHGDMKTDHVFLTPERVTFIDTESMTICDPRYDLACLEVSLIIGTITGQCQADLLDSCREIIRRAGGPGYDWFLDVARLKAACHFAQRPERTNVAAISRAMEV